MVHIREIPLSSLTLSADEEAGHYHPNHSRRHQPGNGDRIPTPQSVRYAWPSVASKPFRFMA
jgi:hypothetical protein